MGDHIPEGYMLDGEYLCNMCIFENFGITGNILSVARHKELWQVAEDAAPSTDMVPTALYSWDEVDPHGAVCSGCDDEIFPAWCEVADPSNAGNGICSNCHLVGASRLEDQYE